VGSLFSAGNLKGGKREPRLLLMANRKLHTRFRLVPKSTTLDDLEEPLRGVIENVDFQGFRVLSSAPWEMWPTLLHSII